MAKFEEVPEDVTTMMSKLVKESFPVLLNARIKMLFLMNKKTSSGGLVLGTMCKSTPREYYLTSSPAGDDGWNYIMILDGNVFPALDEQDQKRIIRHELNHAHIDLEANDPFKVVGHEIEDFFKEIEYNKEEPKWKDRVFAIADQVYEQIEEAKKAAKSKKK